MRQLGSLRGVGLLQGRALGSEQVWQPGLVRGGGGHESVRLSPGGWSSRTVLGSDAPQGGFPGNRMWFLAGGLEVSPKELDAQGRAGSPVG